MSTIDSRRTWGQECAQLVRFLAVGVANTAVGFGIITALQVGLAWSPLAANLAGYAVGWLMSYVLNRRFTFRSQRSHSSAVPRFVVVAALAYVLNALVLLGCVHLLSVQALVAQAIAMTVYTFVFYLLSHHVVFNHHPN
jgi:putative flippase GtrA